METENKEKKKMTAAQARDVIANFVDKNKRLPGPGELSKLTSGEISGVKAASQVAKWRRENMEVLHVIGGKVYKQDGSVVWVQQSAGSLVPARFREMQGLGPTVMP